MKQARIRRIGFRMVPVALALLLMAGTGQARSVQAESGSRQEGAAVSTADHAKFKVLHQEFRSGPEVTRACLECHTEAGHQLQATYHWTWQSHGGVQGGIGKKNVLNNF